MDFTIGTSEFTALAEGAGAYALEWSPEMPVQALATYEVKGVSGLFTSRGDVVSQAFQSVVRYVAADAATLIAAQQADLDQWAAGLVDVVDPAGNTWSRCHVLSARTLPTKAGASGGCVWRDVVLSIVCYEPVPVEA